MLRSIRVDGSRKNVWLPKCGSLPDHEPPIGAVNPVAADSPAPFRLAILSDFLRGGLDWRFPTRTRHDEETVAVAALHLQIGRQWFDLGGPGILRHLLKNRVLGTYGVFSQVGTQMAEYARTSK